MNIVIFTLNCIKSQYILLTITTTPPPNSSDRTTLYSIARNDFGECLDRMGAQETEKEKGNAQPRGTRSPRTCLATNELRGNHGGLIVCWGICWVSENSAAMSMNPNSPDNHHPTQILQTITNPSFNIPQPFPFTAITNNK